MPAKDIDAGVSNAPEELFHTILTIVDWQKDSSGSTRHYFVLGTHGTLEAAKAYSGVALQQIGFGMDEFERFDVRPGSCSPEENWSHDEGVTAFARTPAGQEFTMRINTTPNNESFTVRNDGQVQLPNSARFLHYVLQTIIDYNVDRSGAAQTAEIEGSYVHRADAWAAARQCLDKTQFAEYDSRGEQEFLEEWPFDDDVAVHAVAETGQNYFIAVKTPPHADGGHKAKLKQLVK
ncbi:hypothetical protein PLICBS_004088 [Purpureocillium lilacinum]|uniref:uncharacterized protein n=1 Tax=Purpureocillium lilacinum TaxID=33203 RepID=UPI00208261A3|nr:hypothetical protein PLICBS_004088 [Purpureocillium lilacinum]